MDIFIKGKKKPVWGLIFKEKPLNIFWARNKFKFKFKSKKETKVILQIKQISEI